MLKTKSDVDKLNKTLENGGVIAFVTDTVWGLGCLPDSKKGADKIYEIKGRDRSKPLILMSNDIKNLEPYINRVTPTVKNLCEKYFPGALTIVTEKSDMTPEYITAGKNTIGIRIPDNDFFKSLCSSVKGHVLATTSANLSNMPASKTYEEVVSSLGNAVDIIYKDNGYHCNGKESTVVLISGEKIEILRQGSVIP